MNRSNVIHLFLDYITERLAAIFIKVFDFQISSATYLETRVYVDGSKCVIL